MCVHIVRLRHKPDGAQQIRRFSAETANPSVSQMPPNCWVSEICDAVVIDGWRPSTENTHDRDNGKTESLLDPDCPYQSYSSRHLLSFLIDPRNQNKAVGNRKSNHQ